MRRINHNNFFLKILYLVEEFLLKKTKKTKNSYYTYKLYRKNKLLLYIILRNKY